MPNQYNQKRPKLHRLPAFAVTEEERRRCYQLCKEHRVPLAGLLRIALVVAGVWSKESLDESLPEELVREAMKGRAYETLPPIKKSGGGGG